MDANGASPNTFYHFMIKQDKSATRQLEDLCLGLVKIIRDIDPGQHPDNELTPQRLATFYRKLGGNYDALFTKTGEDGLSFMYRTLGCYHSLQPTRSPFETPRVPCLTANGFARWQTIQVLLSPHEHVPYLQKAVQTWDVERPDGGYFPRHLPTECFPKKPDEAMEKWYRHVTGSLNQDNYMRRLKYSPAQSPYLEPTDRRDSYFPNGQKRNSSQEDEAARAAAYRRRSSVPDIASPIPVGAEGGSHWDPKAKQPRKARSSSATRPPIHNRQRSNTANTPDKYSPRPTSSPTSRRHPQHSDPHHSHSRPSSQQHPHHRPRPSGGRPKSPSTVNENSGSEGSSEDSRDGRRQSRQRKSDEDGASKKNLWVPSFLRGSHKRRHSSETGVRRIEAAKPPTPLRPEYYAPKRQHVASPAVPQTQAPPVMPPRPQQAGVRFRNDMFQDPAHPTPDSPAAQPQPQPQMQHNGLPPPAIRYPDPQQQQSQQIHQRPHPPYPIQQMEDMNMVGQTVSHESSSGSGTDRRYASGSDWDRNAQRKAGAPLRVTTVTGVSGRKYASTEPTSAERHAARMRGSVPTPVV